MPMLARVGQHAAALERDWTIRAMYWPMLDQFGQHVARFDRTWPIWAVVVFPMIAKLGQHSAKFDQLARFGPDLGRALVGGEPDLRTSTNIGRHWSLGCCRGSAGVHFYSSPLRGSRPSTPRPDLQIGSRCRLPRASTPEWPLLLKTL